MTKKPPSYTTPNQQAAAIILADPARHLAWPGELTVEEIEASLMVGWARKVSQIETSEEFKLS